MEFRLGVSLILTFCLLVCFRNTQSQDIDMTGWIRCVETPDDFVQADIHLYDNNNRAVRVVAVRGNGNQADGCQITGSGTFNDAWTITTVVDKDTDLENNPCGVLTTGVGNGRVYRWTFRSFPSLPGTFVGRAFTMTADCSVSEARDHGYLETSKRLQYAGYSHRAENPNSVTGLGAYASGSTVVTTGTIYPDASDTPDGLQGAPGIAFKTCEYATSADMVENVGLFISNGCPVLGSPLTPASSYRRTSTLGESPIVIQANINAVPVGGKKVIYLRCRVTRCDREDHPHCDDPCEAANTGASASGSAETNTYVTTSFTVEDLQAGNLFAALQTDLASLVSVVPSGSRFRLVFQGHPYGIGSNPAMNRATGYYIETCLASLEEDFDNSVVILNNGCEVNNNLVNIDDAFVYNVAQSNANTNLYVLVSGSAQLRGGGRGYYYMRCQYGFCTNSDHNYCKTGVGRCNANNNHPNDHDIVGYVSTKLYARGPQTPAVIPILTGPNGNPIDPGTGTGTVNTGDGPNLSFMLVPGGAGEGGLGNQLSGAAGAYVHSCVATVTNENGNTQSHLVIDDEGCRVPGSPVSVSQNCEDDGENPRGPFVVDCGTVETDLEGDVVVGCKAGVCPLEACPMICGVDPDTQTVNFPGNLSAIAAYKTRDRPIGNTAKRSEEIRTIIVVVTVIAGFLIVLAISCCTWGCLRWQKKRKIC